VGIVVTTVDSIGYEIAVDSSTRQHDGGMATDLLRAESPRIDVYGGIVLASPNDDVGLDAVVRYLLEDRPEGESFEAVYDYHVRMLRWLTNNSPAGMLDINYVLGLDSAVWHLQDRRVSPVVEDFLVLGDGAQAAEAALLLRYGAQEAVQVAIDLTAECWGDVRYVKSDEKEVTVSRVDSFFNF